MSNTETKIEDEAVRQAAALGVRSLKLTLYGDSGWPDRVFLIPGGRPLWIEFKAPGEGPDPLQSVRHAFLEYMGYDIEVHDTVEGAVEAIRRKLAAATAAGWRHSPKKEAALRAQLEEALAASRVSKASSKVPPRTGRRSVIPRPRSR